MVQLLAGLKERGFEYLPSEANFVAFHAGPDAQAIYDGLLREGVIIRPLSGYGMPEYLRVSIGLEAENTAFFAALDLVMKRHS
jgi:histidinol-phosphate aminotransferase